MEEKTLLYLQNTVASLRSAGHHETADTLTRAQEELAEAQWCEMTESILLAVRDPVVLSSAYELHESVLKVIRIDMPPIAYVKLLHSICFSPNVTLPMALELIEDAAVCLVSNSSEQGENAVSCIRALLLLDRNRVDAHGRSTEAAAQEARAILDRVEPSFTKSKCTRWILC
ncbi:hypothetical protein ERJ75_000030700 [Trypanosoma vivax]|nr:hypothetical protein ERJ75_000030700 [Trypanosoma vivax]